MHVVRGRGELKNVRASNTRVWQAEGSSLGVIRGGEESVCGLVLNEMLCAPTLERNIVSVS